MSAPRQTAACKRAPVRALEGWQQPTDSQLLRQAGSSAHQQPPGQLVDAVTIHAHRQRVQPLKGVCPGLRVEAGCMRCDAVAEHDHIQPAQAARQRIKWLHVRSCWTEASFPVPHRCAPQAGAVPQHPPRPCLVCRSHRGHVPQVVLPRLRVPSILKGIVVERPARRLRRGLACRAGTCSARVVRSRAGGGGEGGLTQPTVQPKQVSHVL